MENVARLFVSVETFVDTADTENAFRTKSVSMNLHLYRNACQFHICCRWYVPSQPLFNNRLFRLSGVMSQCIVPIGTIIHKRWILEGNLKEIIVIYSRCNLGIFLEGARKIMNNFSQYNRNPEWHSEKLLPNSLQCCCYANLFRSLYYYISTGVKYSLNLVKCNNGKKRDNKECKKEKK